MVPPPTAFLFDLDGTLYTGPRAIPGAVDLLRALRQRSVPFHCVTNTTSRPRSGLVARMRGLGFEIEPEEIQTPLIAAGALAREQGAGVIAPFVAPETLEDLGGFTLTGGTAAAGSSLHPDIVVVGDLGERWTFALMQQAFRYLLDGARLVALSRDRYWMAATGLTLDAGPFVAGLEYATGAAATVVGKPSSAFFHSAVRGLGLGEDTELQRVAMVGDDIHSDVEGAQQVGCQGWLVRTGKYREAMLRESGILPDRILDSVADLL
jgi:phospholysine phosphohistidine inorganic pyrophosphate phosphatase